MIGVISRPDKCGYKASSTSHVKMHYRSRVWGTDEYFENTYLKNEPLDYKLGNGNLLKGIEDGVHGMCTGEIRRLVIPGDQAYGERGIPNLVPANSAIVVDVEMVYVASPFSPWFWIGGFILFGSLYTFGWPKKQGDIEATKSKVE
ncbi:FK506-binding protein 2A [Sporodiniella umbellata]|nr:FK506-binding protein 2A [Sporodiniella umbellata]